MTTRSRWLAVATATALAGTCGFGTGSAFAAPGQPEPPTTIFMEDFEHGVSTSAVGLASYTGAPPQSTMYTAHPSWLRSEVCNGMIASFNSPAANGTLGCPNGDYNVFIRGMAEAMGHYHQPGGNPDDHIVSEATVASGPMPHDAPAGSAVLQTTEPVALSISDRFVSFSVDVAVKCNLNFPQLRFFLIDGGNEIPAFGAGPPIDPCQPGGGQDFQTTTGLGPVRVGTFAATKGILFNGSSAGVKLTNDQASGFGNDFAIDNIRIVDATPSLHKAFSPDEIKVGETSSVVFTVTNTADLGEKAGWSFEDQLPNGLTVAGAATSDCDNASIDAPQGGATIEMSGDLAAGRESCTVSVPVTASASGTYANGPDQITTVGLNEPAGPVTLTVVQIVASTFCKGAGMVVSARDIRPANPPTAPCAEDEAALAQYRARIGPNGTFGTATGRLLHSRAGFGVENAPGSRGPSATATVAEANIVLGALTLTFRGVESAAAVPDSDSVAAGYDCDAQGAGTSRIAYLAINGQPMTVGDQPMTIPLGIGELRLNHTDAGPGRVVQRAVWLDLAGDGDVVLGESRAGCAFS